MPQSERPPYFLFRIGGSGELAGERNLLSCNGSIQLLHGLGIMRETRLFSAIKDEVVLSLFFFFFFFFLY